jgi:hypothetical protein
MLYVACNAREFIKPPKLPPTVPQKRCQHRQQSIASNLIPAEQTPLYTAQLFPPLQLLTVKISEALLTRKPHFEAVR